MDATPAALTALAAWNGSPAEFPYAGVVDALRDGGRHEAAPALLGALAGVRETAGAREDETLAAFLHTALDKHDGRFDNPSYLALRQLGLPSGGRGCPARTARQRDRLLVLLLTDVVRFELAGARGATGYLPEMRPDERTAAKRCTHAMRAAWPALERLGLAPEGVAEGCPVARALAACEAVEATITPAERRMLELTMLPVSEIHDEHLFVRVLQSYETVFGLVAVQLAAATSMLAAGSTHEAVALLGAAAAGLGEGSPLFSLLGTMDPAAFLRFRERTDGASAIQSRSYKTIESLCRKPEAERLESPAYHSVPEVREVVLAGRAAFEDALAGRRAAGGLCPHADAAIAQTMDAFAGALAKWRRTHHSLASRMLGLRRGTGHTDGVPYLAEAREIPVFSPRCPMAAAA